MKQQPKAKTVIEWCFDRDAKLETAKQVRKSIERDKKAGINGY